MKKAGKLSKSAPASVSREVESENDSPYDSGAEFDSEDYDSEEDDENDEDDEDDEDDEFENQSSDDDISTDGIDSESDNDEMGGGEQFTRSAEATRRENAIAHKTQTVLHTDDLSSDDEENENNNTIGRVPLHWYDAYDHIGYNIAGKKIVKRNSQDRLDIAIANRDDPDSKRTVYDMYNDRDVVLTEREMEIIRRVQAGAFAHPEHNDTPDYVDYYSSKKEVMPLTGAPEPKRRFVPSKWEMMKVMKIVKAIKEGKYKTIAEAEQEKADARNLSKQDMFMIWNDEEDEVLAESRKHRFHLPAPKMPLPGHAESYNPPAEYLLTEEEIEAQMELEPKDRQYDFIPKKFDSLRQVVGYNNFVKERFERCLDLYLCPRTMKRRLNIDPETLVPRLPKPRELKPFPNNLCIQYLGHKKAVTCITVSPDGQYLASGSDDGSVKLWEIDTGFCRYTWKIGKVQKSSSDDSKKTSTEGVTALQWNPISGHHVLAAAVGYRVVLIVTDTGGEDAAELTDSLLAAVAKVGTAGGNLAGTDEQEDDESDADSASEEQEEEGKKSNMSTIAKRDTKAVWCVYADDSTSEAGPRLQLTFQDPVVFVAWHYKGDYLGTLTAAAGSVSGSKAIAIHQLSKAKTQYPFSKSPGRVQAIMFHPSRPYLFVVTQQHVKLYHLIEQKLVKRLLSGCKWLSSIDVHPSGNHVIIGSYDRRVVWFDLDLSSTPYKTLKFHEKAVRDLCFHKRYPLMASASDDGTVHIFHAAVYNDLARNPLIVPLKVLRGHGVKGGLGVLSTTFHPRQPWVFTAGSDGVINLFQDAGM